MSFDFGGSLDSAPTDVPADVNVDPSSADYGSEQLTTDQAANPGDQVANQSGNSDFVNATDPAATDTAPAATNAGATTQIQDDGSTITTNADGTVTATNAPGTSTLDQIQAKAGNLLDQAQSGVKNLGDQITAKASSTLTNLENQFTAQNISNLATKTLNNVITTVEKTAVSLAVGVANKALSTVVGPAAASTLTNGAVNAFNAPPTKSATAVTPTTNPTVPSGYQNEAQQAADGNGDAPVSAKADPQAAQSDDVAKLNADGSVDLSQFNKGPTQLPTNYTGEAVTLPADGNAVVSTSATDVNASVDPNSPNFVGPPNPGTLDKSAAPVADPNLATAPANPGAASINNTAGPVTGDPIAAFNTLNNLTGPTAAGLVNTAVTTAAGTAQGLIRQAQNQQTARLQSNTPAQAGDWRVRLSLAPNSNYLYNAPDPGPVLWPLYNTGGVIFPYTPTIDTSYKANYTPYDLTHSNYRGYFYQSSYVDGVNVKGTFTAQDTAEANYLLAVIHFFRSVTKMFYGQDSQAGSPPPLVFLSGLGDFQFNQHPCVVSQFNYSLPGDVNYIRAQNVLNNGTNQLGARMRQTTLGNPISNAIQRLASLGQGIQPGALSAPFAPQGSLPAGNPTYVPTKMDINITLLPIQSRSQVSQQFSLAGFANGNLLKGGFW